MRTFLLPTALALLFTACGANSGSGPGTGTGKSQDANSTKGSSQDGNSAMSQDGNNASGQATGTSVQGTVQGHALTPKSAIYTVGAVPSADGNTNILVLVISDQADACATVTQGAHTKNSTNLTFVLLKGNTTGNTVAPTSGTYNVSSGGATSLMAGQAELFSYDPTCTNTVPSDKGTVSTGTVSVTSTLVDGISPLTGAFSLTVGSQNERLSGTFNATACPGLMAIAISGSAGGACQ